MTEEPNQAELPTSSLPWWDYWFSSVNGQKCYLRFLLRNAVHQDLRADCCQSPIPTPTMWLSLADSPSDPEDFPGSSWGKTQVGLLGSVPQPRGDGYSLWALFLHWRNYRLRGTLSVLHYASLGEGWCGQSVSSSFHPSNAVLLGLWGSGRVLQSHPPLISGIFTMVSYLWTVVSWSSCEEDWCWQEPILSSAQQHSQLYSTELRSCKQRPTPRNYHCSKQVEASSVALCFHFIVQDGW